MANPWDFDTPIWYERFACDEYPTFEACADEGPVCTTTLNPLVNGADLTPGAVSGNDVLFTASGPVFTPRLVDRQLWKEALDGIGQGRAKIIEFVSTTQVRCQILSEFDNTNVIPEGHWFLTTNKIRGLWHLEGETVGVVTDGAEHPDRTVVNGEIDLEYDASMVHVGKKYFGLLKSMNLEGGGTIGPSQTKKKNIVRLGVRFLNTLGARFGSDLYHMEEVFIRDQTDPMDRPAPLFSGDKLLNFEDSAASEKHLYIQQMEPLPCTILMAVPFVEVDNE